MKIVYTYISNDTDSEFYKMCIVIRNLTWMT